MRKKLYKAKKNWVIGLIAGALFMVGGASTVNADVNAAPTTVRSNAALRTQLMSYSTPKVTWSGIDTSGYQGVTSYDPINIDTSRLDANVNVSMTGNQSGNDPANYSVNRTTPGFTYNVNANGHRMMNGEDVSVDYYFNSNSTTTRWGQTGPEFDPANNSIAYAPTFRHHTDDSWQGVTGYVSNQQINMSHSNDSDMAQSTNPSNYSNMTKAVSVNGNMVTNTVHVNANGAAQPGVWGITIKPNWQVDGVNSVYDTDAPYKNGNAFYYVIRNAQGQPQWLEVIRPQNGMKLFSGHDLGYTTGPIGGQQIAGNNSDAPSSARNLYMMAPEGTSADFSYTESYYWIGDGYNNPQANVNAGYLDSYQLEEDDNGNPVLHVSGWHAASTSTDLPNGWLIVFDNTTGAEIKRQRINPVARPDVAAQYQNVANSSQSGFDERISLPTRVLGHQLTIVTRYSDDANGGEGHHTDLWLNRISFNMNNNASLDGTRLSDGKVIVSGWHATNAALGHQYRYIIAWDAAHGQEIARQRVDNVERDDVGRAFPTVLNANHSGFNASFDLNDPRYANDQIQFISRYTDDWAGNGNAVDYWFTPQRLLSDTGNHANLDGYHLTKQGLQVAGWHATNAAMGRQYHTIIVLDARNGHEIGRQTIYSGSRPDVARAFPGVMNADQSGFNTTIAFNSAMATDPVRVISRWSASRDANSNYVDYWFAPVQLLADQGNYANLDGISWTGRQVQMGGWHASNQAFGKQYHYIILFDQTRGYEVGRQLVESGSYRPDVANAFRGVSNADNSGFNVTITPSVDIRGDRLQVVSRWTDDPAGNGNGTDYWFAPRVVASRPSDVNQNVQKASNLEVFRYIAEPNETPHLYLKGWMVSNAFANRQYKDWYAQRSAQPDWSNLRAAELIILKNGQEYSRATLNCIPPQEIWADLTERPDVAAAYPNIWDSKYSGFEFNIQDIEFDRNARYQVVFRFSHDPQSDNTNYDDMYSKVYSFDANGNSYVVG